MKPHNTLIFLLLLLLVLLAPTFFVPNGTTIFRYPSFERLTDILFSTTDTSKRINLTQLMADDTITIIAVAPNYHTEADTTKAPPTHISTKDTFNSSTSHIFKIEMDNEQTALDHFFEAIRNKEHINGQVRVLHFSDSQIEGDMITSTIRQMLQEQFGGYGVGFIPINPSAPNPSSIIQSCSKGWDYSSVMSSSTEASSYGILGGVSKLEKATEGEYVTIKRYGQSHRNTRFNRLRLLVGQCTTPYKVALTIDNERADTSLVEASSTLNSINYNIPQGSTNIGLELLGDGQLTTYGISQESSSGIFVDNIAVRGSSGIFFTKLDTAFARRLLTEINVKLILVQYGTNAVPNTTDNFNYYESAMTSQLNALKRIKSDASIILIGVSDMSQHTVNGYQSHPNVARVRLAQQKAAKRAGVAFWDFYQAMGGENSMEQWVTSDPPLAQKDFIHLNRRGANIIARRFTNALLLEMNKHLNRSAGNPSQNTQSTNTTQ